MLRRISRKRNLPGLSHNQSLSSIRPKHISHHVNLFAFKYFHFEFAFSLLNMDLSLAYFLFQHLFYLSINTGLLILIWKSKRYRYSVENAEKLFISELIKWNFSSVEFDLKILYLISSWAPCSQFFSSWYWALIRSPL